MKKRYYVKSDPSRNHVWVIHDRETGQQHSEYGSRILARFQAAKLNGTKDHK